MCFVVLLAYSFIVFVLSSPLRPLSRIASDYFSDSVVCIGILRPLRPLREIKRQSSLICGQFSVPLQPPSALRASPPLWGEGLARCFRL